MSERYPLTWPEGWKRTPPSERKAGKFSTGEIKYGTTNAFGATPTYRRNTSISVFMAVKRIQEELDRLGVRDGDAIISTNIPVRLDGTPRSDRSEPSDPGAAVYWELKGRKQSMGIDRYHRVADNLAAIAATLEALRTVERHGGAEILERSFRGFTALPEHTTGRSWRDVLGFTAEQVTPEQIKSRFNRLVVAAHPDKPGGSREAFEELVIARDQGLSEVLNNT